MDNDTLRQLQEVELDILKALNQFCRAHGIKYSLYAGTMLGAVRHGGFIPWDDDIDIAMTREEYTKFCDSINRTPIDGYVFSDLETDEDCSICHGKLGKVGTVFIQDGEIESKGHHEIWVDIFPIDKLAINESEKKETMKLGREQVLLTRANASRSNDRLKKRIVRSALRIIPKRCRYNRIIKNLNKLKRINHEIKDDYEWISMSTLESIEKYRFPKEMMEDYTEIYFEGMPFMSIKDYRGMLTILFGDYMKLPPIEDRVCKHNPVKISF